MHTLQLGSTINTILDIKLNCNISILIEILFQLGLAAIYVSAI